MHLCTFDKKKSYCFVVVILNVMGSTMPWSSDCLLSLATTRSCMAHSLPLAKYVPRCNLFLCFPVNSHSLPALAFTNMAPLSISVNFLQHPNVPNASLVYAWTIIGSWNM